MAWLDHPFMQQQAALILALIGAVIGSFISLVAYRIPKNMPIIAGRSQCTSCGKKLGACDLIPLISWAWRKGKARCCGAKISIRYPLIELASALGALALICVFGFNPVSMIFVLMWWCALALIVTDLEAYLLPNQMLIALGALGAIYVTYIGYPQMEVLKSALIGLGIGLGLRFGALIFLKKPGLGLGDVKLFAVSGLWLASPMALVPFMFYAGIFGILFALIWRMMGHGKVFPFGPSMLSALLLCTLYPQSIRIFWQLYV
jgi:prepilin signal peptidase PulO-like enzyme (type II secretory pathway)